MKRIKKEAKKLNQELDNATRAIGQEANHITGIDISHVVNPEASDHKEALRDAREKLGMSDNQENTELTGVTPQEQPEG